MSRKNKIKILATAAALSVSGVSCSNAENENDGDMEKQSLIEKLKGLVDKGAKAVMPEMAMCYEVPAQPREEFTCPQCGSVHYVWDNGFEEVTEIIERLKAQGHDVKVERICQKCAGLIPEDSDANDITFKFYYKAPKAKKYNIAYSTNPSDYYAVEAALNGKDSYVMWGDTIQLSTESEVLKKMLGK